MPTSSADLNAAPRSSSRFAAVHAALQDAPDQVVARRNDFLLIEGCKFREVLRLAHHEPMAFDLVPSPPFLFRLDVDDLAQAAAQPVHAPNNTSQSAMEPPAAIARKNVLQSMAKFMFPILVTTAPSDQNPLGLYIILHLFI